MVKVGKCIDRAATVENRGITSRQTASGATGARATRKGSAASRRKKGGKASKGREMYDKATGKR